MVVLGYHIMPFEGQGEYFSKNLGVGCIFLGMLNFVGGVFQLQWVATPLHLPQSPENQSMAVGELVIVYGLGHFQSGSDVINIYPQCD